MLSQPQAQAILQETLPGIPIKAWAKYRDVYLFRVEYLSEAEKDFDPFFSVDIVTEEARDFSVITDGNLSEISKLEWNDI